MIRKWIAKFETEIIVSLIIAIAGLYIIYFGKYIAEKPINVLLAIAAITSSIFLWLAFRESRRGNNLIIYQKLYDEFWDKITNQEKIMGTRVFSNNESLNRNYINIPTNLTYRSYAISLIAVLKSFKKGIDDQSVYSKNWSNDTESGSFINLRNFIDNIKIIKESNNAYTDRIFEISSLYKKIDKSNLDIDQKTLLIERLYLLSQDYTNFCLKINKKEFLDLKSLTIPLLIGDNENKWRVSSGDNIIQGSFFVPYNTIDELNNKYRIKTKNNYKKNN